MLRARIRTPTTIFFSIALLGSALLPACYRPQVIPGPKPPSVREGLLEGTLPKVAGLRLHVFNTGANRVSSLLVGSPAPWRPVPAFVIEHPSQGLIVFDCGLGEDVGEKGDKALHPITRLLFKTRSRPGLDLASQMRKAGLEPTDVKTVIFSHMHFDHVGSAGAFRQAEFVVGRSEREHSDSRMNGFEPSHTDWIPAEAWREIDFREAKPYATFERAVDLFGDHSIILIAGGGHTHGGMGALLALPNGPAFLTGDLIVHFDWLDNDDVQRIVADGRRAARVRNHIRLLKRLAPDSAIFPGHDLSRAPENRDDIVLHRRGDNGDREDSADLFDVASWPID